MLKLIVFVARLVYSQDICDWQRNADRAQCGGTAARWRDRLPRNDSVLSHCFSAPHFRGQRSGAPVVPSKHVRYQI
jgi:hypothetical protein